MPAGNDIVVHPSAPMPKGYTFVPKGNVYITAHCRSLTHAANKPLYVVAKKVGATSSGSSGVLGLRCPTHIAAAVRHDEQASRRTRLAATAKRDDALAATFRDAVLAAYPLVPRDTVVPQIVQHAMVKKQGRVARTSTLDLGQRVRLAVRAHIRHRHTNYDALLRGGGSSGQNEEGGQKRGKRKRGGRRPQRGTEREKARALTLGQVDAIERQWAGKAGNKKARQQTTLSKNDENEEVAVETDSDTAASRKSREGSERSGGDSLPIRTASTRPTRQCKSQAASRIAQCLQAQSASGRASNDAIVIDSSDEDDDIIMIDSDDDDYT